MVTLIGSIVSGMEYNIGSNKCSSGKTIAVLIAFDGSGIAPDEINPFRISCVCLACPTAGGIPINFISGQVSFPLSFANNNFEGKALRLRERKNVALLYSSWRVGAL